MSDILDRRYSRQQFRNEGKVIPITKGVTPNTKESKLKATRLSTKHYYLKLEQHKDIED